LLDACIEQRQQRLAIPTYRFRASRLLLDPRREVPTVQNRGHLVAVSISSLHFKLGQYSLHLIFEAVEDEPSLPSKLYPNRYENIRGRERSACQ